MAEKRKARKPAMTPEARENQMIALAVDLAEQKMLDGTASAQIVTHYLKLGSMKERLERERMEQEIELMKAKIDALESTKRVEELYKDALTAMKAYQGGSDGSES